MSGEQVKLEQANVRVDPESFEILEAAAFVRGYRGLQELLRPEVEAFAEKLKAEPEVQRALEARRAYEARTVTPLKPATPTLRPTRRRRTSTT